MLSSNAQAKNKIEELVVKYETLTKGSDASKLSEEETKKDFILPLFRALNWNTEDSKEVSAEETISKKRVDYGFRIDGIPKFFVEAKTLKERLDFEHAKQAINYSWLKSTTWAVLTNFVELKVYNAEWKSRNPIEQMFFELKWTDYVEKFDKLWLLSKDSFLANKLDEIAEEWGKKQKKTLITPVTEQLFDDLIRWRQVLTNDTTKWKVNRQTLKTDEDLDESVQRILDRLIFIRVCEDRQLEPYTLLSKLREWKDSGKGKPFYKLLIQIFREFDSNYNSKLFSQHLSERLEISDFAISEVIFGLYDSREGLKYDFSAIDSDVLGNIYEEYLSFMLRKGKKQARIVSSYVQRKKMGIYYTPTHVVDFIVKSTVERVLQERDDGKIKVLDPACGSGSFLIKALTHLVEHNRISNFEDKMHVLKNCIYGVDLDPKAVEIAQLNLLLRILEKRKVLPVLDSNIKVGNSLVEDPNVDERAFNWQEEFETPNDGGFDVVIGNPPYINAIQLSKTVGKNVKDYWKAKFQSAKGTYDIYVLFFEQALNLCKEGGYVSFITPNKYLSSPYGTALRELILKNYTLVKVVDLSRTRVFNDPSVYPIITIIQKRKASKPYMITTQKVFSEGLTSRIEYEISSETLKMMPDYNWGIILSDNAKIIQKIFEKGKPLEQVSTVQATSTAAESDEYSNYISERSGMLIINTGTIDRYATKYGVVPLTNKGKKLLKPLLYSSKISENRKILYSSPKIIFAKIALRPEGFLDVEGKYASINTNCVHKPLAGYDLKYLAAILNSKLMTFVYSELFSGLKMSGGYFQFQAPQLRILPITDSSDDIKSEIAKLAHKIISLNDKLNSLGDKKTEETRRLEEETEEIDKRIDDLIYKVYGLTAEEIEIVEKSFTAAR